MTVGGKRSRRKLFAKLEISKQTLMDSTLGETKNRRITLINEQIGHQLNSKSMESLPDYLLIKIFQWFDDKSLFQMELVSKRIQKVVWLVLGCRKTSLDLEKFFRYYEDWLNQRANEDEEDEDMNPTPAQLFFQTIWKPLLKKCKYLTRLTIRGCAVPSLTVDDTLLIASCCPYLTTLVVVSVNVSSDWFSLLKQFNYIQNLTMCPFIDGSTQIGILTSDQITLALTEAFVSWKSLKRLSIAFAHLNVLELICQVPATVESVELLTQCISLATLEFTPPAYMNYFKDLIKSSLVTFFRSHPKLKKFQSKICTNLVDAAFVVEQLAKYCPDIEWIELETVHASSLNLGQFKKLNGIGFGDCTVIQLPEQSVNNLVQTLCTCQTKPHLICAFRQLQGLNTWIVQVDQLSNVSSLVLQHFFNETTNFGEFLRFFPNLTSLHWKSYVTGDSGIQRMIMLGRHCKKLNKIIFGQRSNDDVDMVRISALAVSLSMEYARPSNSQLNVQVSWPKHTNSKMKDLLLFRVPIKIKNNLEDFW